MNNKFKILLVITMMIIKRKFFIDAFNGVYQQHVLIHHAYIRADSTWLAFNRQLNPDKSSKSTAT